MLCEVCGLLLYNNRLSCVEMISATRCQVVCCLCVFSASVSDSRTCAGCKLRLDLYKTILNTFDICFVISNSHSDYIYDI